MSRALAHLEAEALELSTRDRAALAHRLIVSLDEGSEDDPTEVELAWEQELCVPAAIGIQAAADLRFLPAKSSRRRVRSSDEPGKLGLRMFGTDLHIT